MEEGELQDPVETACASEDRSHLLPRLLRGPLLDVLARISTEDPLRLYPLGARRIRERFLLFDPDRMFERFVPRVLAVAAATALGAGLVSAQKSGGPYREPPSNWALITL